MPTLDLNGSWELHYVTRADTPADDFASVLAGGYRQVPAKVPGNVESDLMAAGELPDLYVGSNIKLAQDLEYGDWWYSRRFRKPEWAAGDGSTMLVFEGVDTIADVYVNGELVGSPRNQLVPHEIVVTDVLRDDNELVVHLHSPVRYAEQFEYPALVDDTGESLESLRVRKAAHMSGWDIAPRLVSAGIWRGVRLEQRPRLRFTDVYVRTVSVAADRSEALLGIAYTLTDSPRGSRWRLLVEGRPRSGGEPFRADADVRFRAGRMTVTVRDPRLWWPKGYGAAELYDLRLTLVVDGTIGAEWAAAVGIRTVAVPFVGLPPPDGDLRVVVNGWPVLLLGTNWTPLDALHGRDGERLEPALRLLGDVGCNAVRCWGGNVYESEAFFDWCDRNGVLVWQDFALACGRYPQDDGFLAELASEAEAVVKRLRNHPSLMVWCGNNENDYFYVRDGIDPNRDRTSRELLPRVVLDHDPARTYFPCSPYYTPEIVGAGAEPPDRHLWGARGYFKGRAYSDSTGVLITEVGFQGLPAPASIRRFLPGSVTVDSTDEAWRWHETTQLGRKQADRMNRVQLTVNQARRYLGAVGDDLESMAIASQIAQAEALKYTVESTRMSGGRRSGVLWWNLLDCWPQISDAVVDYYFTEKLGYYYVRRVQAPVCLMVGEEHEWSHDVVLDNLGPEAADVRYRVFDVCGGQALLAGSGTVPARGQLVVGVVRSSTAGPRCLGLEWQVGDVVYANHYVQAEPPLDLPRYQSEWLPAIAALGTPIPIDRIWR